MLIATFDVRSIRCIRTKGLKSLRGLYSQPETRAQTKFEHMDDIKLEDILMAVAMGHSLNGTESPLASLSKDIIQGNLRVAIESSYWDARSDRGLLTPVKRCKPSSRFDSNANMEIMRRETLICRPRSQSTLELPQANNPVSDFCRFISNRHSTFWDSINSEAYEESGDSISLLPAVCRATKFRRLMNEP